MDSIFTLKYFEVKSSLSSALIPHDTSATFYCLDFESGISIISKIQSETS